MSTLLRWQVGAVRITRVQELEAPGMRFIVPQATIENLAGIPWLTPWHPFCRTHRRPTHP